MADVDRVTYRDDPEVIAELDALAASQFRSRSALVKIFVRAGLSANSNPEIEGGEDA